MSRHKSESADSSAVVCFIFYFFPSLLKGHWQCHYLSNIFCHLPLSDINKVNWCSSAWLHCFNTGLLSNQCGSKSSEIHLRDRIHSDNFDKLL